MIPTKYIFKSKTLLFFVVILFFTQLAKAQNNEQALTRRASTFYAKISGESKAPENYIILDVEKEIKNYAFNFVGGGFVIVKDDEPTYTILAFSEEGAFSIENNRFLAGRSDKAIQVTLDTTNFVPEEPIASASISRDINTTVEPFLTDLWGGVNCFDDQDNMVYPTNYYTPFHCSPGCVAIANAQILHYYEWPIIGVGSNTYYDDYSGAHKSHSAFYDEENYDWDHMLDDYYGEPSTDQEQRAVGKLMYDMGVAVEMDYEESGSENNLDNVPYALANYFRFSGFYESESWSPFWSRLYESIQQQRPVPIAVYATETTDGHVVVANGYKYEDNTPYYYLNWGWYNVGPTYNGWYNIQGWNSGSAGYNTITGAIFDMLPEPQITAITPNGTGDDFIIEWEVAQHLNWTEFTLEQKVDYASSWEEVASGITSKNYTITNPTGTIYQFRVKAKSEGNYYDYSWSEVEVYAVEGSYNGIAKFEGSQYAYAKQTPDNDIRFTIDYTFETWIKAENDNQNEDIIMDQRGIFSLQLSEVTASDYSVQFKSYSNSNTTLQSNQTGSKLQTGQWHHVAVSNSGTTTRLFIDGVLRDSYTGSDLNLLFHITNPLNIGEKWHGSYSSHIKADFDQMRISTNGRYTADFTPDQNVDFMVDDDTVAYFKFQNKHRNRFKDEAFNLSVRVSNSTGNVTWTFLGLDNTLPIDEQELLNEVLQIYPNPTTDKIKINYTDNSSFNFDDFSFYLFDSNGKNIPIKVIDQEINLLQVSTGTYFLNVKGNNFTATQKIIKQ